VKTLWEVIVAGALGFIFTLGALLIITFVAGEAFGQDQTVATRPATLGEQDRSLNYKGQPHYQSEEHAQEHQAYLVERESSRTRALACHERNLYLHYMLVDIAKAIARNPELGYIYKGALQSIRDSWCH
jgi:hypothetical protein